MKLRIPYAPHPGQQLFHSSSARNRVLACGARWGKDRACIAESLRLTVELLRLSRPGLVPGVHGWFVAPNYPLAQQLWRELRAFTPPALLAQAPAERSHRLLWKGGALVEIKSADDPRSLVAVGLDWVVLTEAALMAEEAWEMALRPRLASPGRAGLAIFNGTPKGLNWYHRLYLRGLDPAQPEWESWNLPTAATLGAEGQLVPHPYGNPHISLEEIAQARQDMPERFFRQEFLAEFLSGEGVVFREVRARVGAPPASPTRPVVAGADLARRRDFTVFAAFDGEGRMVGLQRLRLVPYPQQAEACCSFLAQHGVRRVVVEANGPGDPFIDMLEGVLHARRVSCRIVPHQTTAASKRQLIEGLVVAFERGQITLLDNPVLLYELEAYEAELTSGGQERYGAPSGAHDDCVMACALAWSEVASARQRHRQYAPFTPALAARLRLPNRWTTYEREALRHTWKT